MADAALAAVLIAICLLWFELRIDATSTSSCGVKAVHGEWMGHLNDAMLVQEEHCAASRDGNRSPAVQPEGQRRASTLLVSCTMDALTPTCLHPITAHHRPPPSPAATPPTGLRNLRTAWWPLPTSGTVGPAVLPRGMRCSAINAQQALRL